MDLDWTSSAHLLDIYSTSTGLLLDLYEALPSVTQRSAGRPQEIITPCRLRQEIIQRLVFGPAPPAVVLT